MNFLDMASIRLAVGLVLWSSPDVKMNENLAIEQQGQESSWAIVQV